MIRRAFVALALLCAAVATARAQTSPGFVNGQLITALQLNNAFAAKADYPAPGNCIFSPCPPTIPVVNNSVLATDGSGHVLFQTTLPASLTIPSPNFSGTGAAGILNGTFSVQTSGAGSFGTFSLGSHSLTLGSNTALPALTGSNTVLVDTVAGQVNEATVGSGLVLGATTGSNTALVAANNLSDVASAATARTNLGLGSASAVTFGALSFSALVGNSTAPTVASGGCTGGAGNVVAANGTAAFQVALGSSACGSTMVLTMPAASHGWVCDAHDVTTPASNAVDETAIGSTTSVTLTNFVRTTGVAGNFAASDVIAVKCSGY